ncbi:MAG: M48 family metalloprotease [candidate division Zixibacteria bacterium]|nr:M48 family metalloprotease [candidate division Zixibacteria bacterium]
MWELIRLNKRKSMVLFVIMGIFLVVLGYVVGAAYAGPEAGWGGVAVALLIWGIWSLIGYFSGDKIILKMSGAKEVTPDVHPQLFNVVEEMKIASGLPVMPKVYIIDTPALNAFAIGRKPENCAIAVTAGLLARLNRDELQGVVAHETGHIHNRDVQFMTYAGIMLGAIIIISHIFLRSLWFGAGSNRRFRSKSGGKGGGQGQAIIMIVAIVFAILAPIAAQLMYFALSRKREYLADASAVRFTRYPEGLASALEKLANSKEDMPRVNKATAPMYIINPLKKKGRKVANLTSTHPPISERIKILRSIASGAGYNDYQTAFSKVTGKGGALVPPSALADKEKISIRDASPDADKPKAAKNEKRELGDIMRAVNEYVFMACVGCGLKMKIPPDFKKEKFDCPRCGTANKVPLAQMAAAGVILEGVQEAQKRSKEKEQVYHRKGTEWQSFRCKCGKTLQLSPYFSGSHMNCSNCGRSIRIEG